MQIINSDKVIYTFKNEMEAVAKVKPNEIFKVMTNDCFFRQIVSEDQTIEELDFDKVNPATGPIYIEGAEVGDILKIEIFDIEVEEKGVSMAIPNGGALAAEEFNPITKVIEVKDDFVHIYGLKLQAKPMIGVIGVAPKAEDGEWGTETPWKHGGNMDTTEIKKGNTLYLPVNQVGALLALGDLHGLMGDGELCMTGLEINGSVTLKVELIKGKTIEWPLIESEKEIMVVASGDNVEMAIQNGAKEAVNYFSKGLDIKFEEAYVLSSLVTDIKISQVVNPKKTIRASIPKKVLSMNKLIEIL